MGRGNIEVLFEDGRSVFLYGHWSGSELPTIVQGVLRRRLRWNDGAYLTRMLFCALVRGDEDGEHGFGIAPHICDNEHPIVRVCIKDQVVSFEPEPLDFRTSPIRATDHGPWSFAAYVETDIGVLHAAFAVRGR